MLWVLKRCFLGLFLWALLATPVHAQRAAVEINRGEQIPNGYKTWTLFLICNPAWLSSNGEAKVEKLHDAFVGFSKAIGTQNLAVWFTDKQSKTSTPTNYDGETAADFCTAYNLESNRSPFLILTTSYPALFGAPGDFSSISLNGLDTDNTEKLLGSIADQVREAKFDTKQLGARESWRHWAQLLQTGLTGIGRVGRGVKVTINTAVFKFEIDGARIFN